MVHIAESTVGRRYAGWFIKNTERGHRVLDELKSSPLPAPQNLLNAPQGRGAAGAAGVGAGTGTGTGTGAGEVKAGQQGPQKVTARTQGPAKVAWGGVKA